MFTISFPIGSNIVGFVLFGLLLKKTVFGKNVLAVGGNGGAALLAGPFDQFRRSKRVH